MQACVRDGKIRHNPDGIAATIIEMICNDLKFHDMQNDTEYVLLQTVLKEQKNGLPIDLLPIDAVFMPIKRVSYNVEPARVGESLDYDKLTLEIWSNGSIEVGAALSKASNLLIEHFSQIAGISGTPVQIKQQEVAQEVVEEVAVAPTLSIEDLELSVRAYNCLKRASINSMSELLKKSEHDLLNIKNFGKKSSDEVIEKLHQMGLDLQPNPEDADDLELI